MRSFSIDMINSYSSLWMVIKQTVLTYSVVYRVSGAYISQMLACPFATRHIGFPRDRIYHVLVWRFVNEALIWYRRHFRTLLLLQPPSWSCTWYAWNLTLQLSYRSAALTIDSSDPHQPQCYRKGNAVQTSSRRVTLRIMHGVISRFHWCHRTPRIYHLPFHVSKVDSLNLEIVDSSRHILHHFSVCTHTASFCISEPAFDNNKYTNLVINCWLFLGCWSCPSTFFTQRNLCYTRFI